MYIYICQIEFFKQFPPSSLFEKCTYQQNFYTYFKLELDGHFSLHLSTLVLDSIQDFFFASWA